MEETELSESKNEAVRDEQERGCCGRKTSRSSALIVDRAKSTSRELFRLRPVRAGESVTGRVCICVSCIVATFAVLSIPSSMFPMRQSNNNHHIATLVPSSMPFHIRHASSEAQTYDIHPPAFRSLSLSLCASSSTLSYQ